MLVVVVYIVSGDYDGEQFACGPFADKGKAEAEMVKLNDVGTPELLELRIDAATIRAEIGVV